MTTSLNEVGRTAGPWVLLPASFSSRIFVMRKDAGSDEAAIAEVRDRANAAFIVRACNMHDELVRVLAALEPYLDAIVCYASTLNEHEPNRLAVEARAILTRAQEEGE